MTVYRVYSGGDNTDGSTWAKAFTSLASAIAAATGAGPHTILWDDGTTDSITSAVADINAATAGQVLRIISVTRSGASGYSAFNKGGAITVATNAFTVNIATSRAQTLTLIGMVITGNSGSSAANTLNIASGNNATSVTLLNCTISCPGSSVSARITIGMAIGGSQKVSSVIMRDTVITTKSSTTNSAILVRYIRLRMSGVTHTFGGANKSPTLFAFSVDAFSEMFITDSDLSGFNAGNYLDVTSLDGAVRLTNCRLHATPGLVTGTFPSGFGSVTSINSSATDTVQDYYYTNLYGTIVHDTTYVAANGAKVNGTLTSWKITTTASCTEASPFVTPWINTWGPETSAINVDQEMLWNSATPATDRDIHPEFEYVSSASFPLGTFLWLSNIAPFDGTANNWATAGDTWSGSLSPSDSRKIRVPNPTSPGSTLTPSEKSVLRWRLHVGVASLTGLYVDPCIRITGRAANPPVYWMSNGEVWQEPVASAGSGSVTSPTNVFGTEGVLVG